MDADLQGRGRRSPAENRQRRPVQDLPGRGHGRREGHGPQAAHRPDPLRRADARPACRASPRRWTCCRSPSCSTATRRRTTWSTRSSRAPSKGLAKKGYVLLGWSEAGFVNLMSTVPVDTLEKVRKAKVWIWSDAPMAAAIFKEAGVPGVPLNIPDVLVGPPDRAGGGGLRPALGRHRPAVVHPNQVHFGHPAALPPGRHRAEEGDLRRNPGRRTRPVVLEIFPQALQQAARRSSARRTRTPSTSCASRGSSS